MLVAPPVAGYSERVYQVFGKETLDQLIPVAAVQPLERVGLPQPPPWRRQETEDDESRRERRRCTSPGEMRLHGFVSKPEIQKLNRNSIFIFVNGRLIRDRLVQHAIDRGLSKYYSADGVSGGAAVSGDAGGRGGCECASLEDGGALPQQSTVMHDFVRDTVRAALMKARPAPQFTTEIHAHATASSGLTPGAREWEPPSDLGSAPGAPRTRLSMIPRAGGVCAAGSGASAGFGTISVRGRNCGRGECCDSGGARARRDVSPTRSRRQFRITGALRRSMFRKMRRGRFDIGGALVAAAAGTDSKFVHSGGE